MKVPVLTLLIVGGVAVVAYIILKDRGTDETEKQPPVISREATEYMFQKEGILELARLAKTHPEMFPFATTTTA